MSVTVTGSLTVRVEATRTETLDLSTDTSDTDDQNTTTLSSGTGAGQVDEKWADSRTATAAVDDIDLSNLTEGERSGIKFATIKVLRIYNTTTTSGYTLTVGAAASNPISSLFGDTSDKVVIGAGGELVLSNYTNGFAVTDNVADILRCDPGANTITYDIEILGVSA